MMFAASVDGPFCVLLCIIAIENDVVYIHIDREGKCYNQLYEQFTYFPCVLCAFQYIFSYNFCVRAYNDFPRGRYLDVEKLFHLIPIRNSCKAIC